MEDALSTFRPTQVIFFEDLEWPVMQLPGEEMRGDFDSLR